MARLKEYKIFSTPTCGYCHLLKDWLNEKKIALEILLGIKRAGADILITYWAKDLAKWLAK